MDTHELVRILHNTTKDIESLRQTKTKKDTGTVMNPETTKITRRGTDNTKRRQKRKEERTENETAMRTTRTRAKNRHTP